MSDTLCGQFFFSFTIRRRTHVSVPLFVGELSTSWKHRKRNYRNLWRVRPGQVSASAGENLAVLMNASGLYRPLFTFDLFQTMHLLISWALLSNGIRPSLRLCADEVSENSKLWNVNFSFPVTKTRQLVLLFGLELQAVKSVYNSYSMFSHVDVSCRHCSQFTAVTGCLATRIQVAGTVVSSQLLVNV
jgi:hypothetical protein